MKVLHDYDDPHLNWRWAMFLGIKLVVYSFSKLLGFKLGFNEDIHDWLYEHALTLAKLDRLCGVESVFGIQDAVEKRYPDLKNSLVSHGADVRRHIHMGDNYKDPDRKRLWEPPLKQSERTWHYDDDYIAGDTPELAPGELPIWHVDRPYWLPKYIEFLYEKLVEDKD